CVTGGLPVVLVTAATLTTVSPTAEAAAVVVCPPMMPVSLPICSDVPPMCCRMGVAFRASLTVAGNGFSTVLSSWTPPTLKPGMPCCQNGAAGSSVDRICASGAVPAGWTDEYVAWSDAVYAGTVGVCGNCGLPAMAPGAEPAPL